MFRRPIIMILILVMLASTVVGCRPAQNTPAPSTGDTGNGSEEVQVTTIRVGHVLAPNHPYTTGLEKFAELMAEKTDNKVKVEVFHSSQLGNERDMIEGLQLGTLEMALVSTAPL